MKSELLIACAVGLASISAGAHTIASSYIAVGGLRTIIGPTAAGSHPEAGDGMEQSNQSIGKTPEVSRRTLRLTIRSSATGFSLVSVERLPMITPPQPGERPEVGTHSGQWFELRDGNDRVLAHRLIDPSLLNSVEVHSPDGNIRREFGEPKDAVFEVLLPDVDGAQFAVLTGDALTPPKDDLRTAARSGDIARFDLSQALKEK
jgi:hypothetical protein